MPQKSSKPQQGDESEKKQDQSPGESDKIRIDEPHEIASHLTESQLKAFVEGLAELIPASNAPEESQGSAIEKDEDLGKKIDEYI